MIIHNEPNKKIGTQKSIGRSTNIKQLGNKHSQVYEEQSGATMTKSRPSIPIIND